ncbi:MAG TPA: hydroxymethylglutaryl-CoA reductase, degradative [Candidatus Thermoplasmatota archaeon]|nr:hydroxymethylglutaryl-CoA reductase, degradative [Candidatus Thermoplasmatota archaeon]
MPTSRLPGFFKLPPAERAAVVARETGLTKSDLALLAEGPDRERLDPLVENVVGLHPLPFGVATNFTVNGRDRLVPMVVEESSVVAAASHAAKMTRPHGGFKAKAGGAMVSQIALKNVPNAAAARALVAARTTELLAVANAAQPGLARRGGGARFIEVRRVTTERGTLVVVHLHVDTVDAMGANAVNTMAEALAPVLEEMTGGTSLMRILTNLADQRLATAEAVFDKDELGGPDVVERILDAAAFADADPYRATTHNKGIMNGIDAVVVATGNDWRAVEAGAHAYAARFGRYRSLSTFSATPEGHLRGRLTLPMALGIVGGATKAHPTAGLALKILGVESANELAEVAASVGLAQNVAAMRALVSEGIQKGHMRLHAKNFALMAGVPAERLEEVAERLVAEGDVKLSRAEAIWKEMAGR